MGGSPPGRCAAVNQETAAMLKISGSQRESIHHHPVKGRKIPVGADLLPQHTTGRIFDPDALGGHLSHTRQE